MGKSDVAAAEFGCVAIIEALNMLKDVPLKGWDDVESVHMVAETMRRVFADRAAYLADPDFANVPANSLHSKDRQSATGTFAKSGSARYAARSANTRRIVPPPCARFQRRPNPSAARPSTYQSLNDRHATRTRRRRRQHFPFVPPFSYFARSTSRTLVCRPPILLGNQPARLRISAAIIAPSRHRKTPLRHFGNPFQRRRQFRLLQGVSRFPHFPIVQKNPPATGNCSNPAFSSCNCRAAFRSPQTRFPQAIAGPIASASFIVPNVFSANSSPATFPHRHRLVANYRSPFIQLSIRLMYMSAPPCRATSR